MISLTAIRRHERKDDRLIRWVRKGKGQTFAILLDTLDKRSGKIKAPVLHGYGHDGINANIELGIVVLQLDLGVVRVKLELLNSAVCIGDNLSAQTAHLAVEDESLTRLGHYYEKRNKKL